MSQERRKYTRLESKQEISVSNNAQQVWEMRVRDYSMRGVGIAGTIYTKLPSLGEKLSVKFAVKVNNNQRNINMTGTVRYIELQGVNFHMGLEF